jgi:hypothetical protein
MKILDALESARYVTDPQGRKTDIVIPLETWKKLLQSFQSLLERLEDQEDRALLEEWLARRTAGETDTVALKDLEAELVADGLLPG